MNNAKKISFNLPWPPSINHYWRHTKNGHYISAKGKAFREEVFYACINSRIKFPDDARLLVEIEAFPPDKRKRDLDNILKSLLDSLQTASIYKDDSQIDRLIITRKTTSEGRITVMIEQIN